MTVSDLPFFMLTFFMKHLEQNIGTNVSIIDILYGDGHK